MLDNLVWQCGGKREREGAKERERVEGRESPEGAHNRRESGVCFEDGRLQGILQGRVLLWKRRP